MNEGDLVMLAEHATASQVDRIVSAYRGVLTADEETERANRQVIEQYLRTDWADDGSLVIHARVPTEIGALFLRALEVARDELCADACGEGGPAGPVHRLESATNVDALHVMAESLLANGAASRDGADRYQVGIHVDADVLTDDDPTGVCELDDGPALAPETVRRLTCDASVLAFLRNGHRTPIAATDATKTVTQRTRRLVRARDRGCRFPGCGARRFTDVHHVRHRAHRGRHTLDNLVELCWFHHRLVHEGGWKLRFDDHGRVVVTNPAGNVIPTIRSLSGTADRVVDRNRSAGVAIDADARSRRAGTATRSTSATSPPRCGAPISERPI